jgi:prephenate dehydratase
MTGDGPVRAAFQGELGAYSHEALRCFLGDRAEAVPCRTFQEVADRTASGSVECGLLPVENTLAGAVVGSYDVLATSPLSIIGEVVIPIRHCLLGPEDVRPAALRRVLSHPVALAQCEAFLARHPEVEAEAFYDTAGAAREVAARSDPATAAIASKLAGERYGLRVLSAGIEDRTDNQTRFYVVVPEGEPPRFSKPTESCAPVKVVLLAEVPNEPGALLRLLTPLSDHGLNLTSLQGRPTGDPWQYRFFLEMLVPGAAPDLEGMLELVRGFSTRCRVLGIFPAAVPPVERSA